VESTWRAPCRPGGTQTLLGSVRIPGESAERAVRGSLRLFLGRVHEWPPSALIAFASPRSSPGNLRNSSSSTYGPFAAASRQAPFTASWADRSRLRIHCAFAGPTVACTGRSAERDPRTAHLTVGRRVDPIARSKQLPAPKRSQPECPTVNDQPGRALRLRGKWLHAPPVRNPWYRHRLERKGSVPLDAGRDWLGRSEPDPHPSSPPSRASYSPSGAPTRSR
jgi:hypothetical protein